jgi:hypothetical protein
MSNHPFWSPINTGAKISLLVGAPDVNNDLHFSFHNVELKHRIAHGCIFKRRVQIWFPFADCLDGGVGGCSDYTAGINTAIIRNNINCDNFYFLVIECKRKESRLYSPIVYFRQFPNSTPISFEFKDYIRLSDGDGICLMDVLSYTNLFQPLIECLMDYLSGTAILKRAW